MQHRHNQNGYKHRLSTMIEEFEKKTFEREDLIRVVILTIFSKQHIFLFGEPGVGKTYIARRAAYIFGNDNYWEILMALDTTVSQLVGSLKTDENGRVYRELIDTMLNKPFVFLDEMFKASNSVLNALLEPMLDRTYTQGGYSIDVPLVTLFGASNEFPEGDSIKPFEDRLMFRYDVKRMQQRENKLLYAKGMFDKTKDFKTKFDFDEIDYVFKHADKIIFSDEMLEQYISLQEIIRKDGIKISDRKFGPDQAVKVFKVSAYLNGRSEINVSDFMLLRHIAWHSLTDKRKLDEVLNKAFFGNVVAIGKILDDLKDMFLRTQGNMEAFCSTLFSYHAIFNGTSANNQFMQSKGAVEKYYFAFKDIYSKVADIDQRRNYALHIEQVCKENIFLYDIVQDVFLGQIDELLNGLIISTNQNIEMLETWLEKNATLFAYNNNYHAKAS